MAALELPGDARRPHLGRLIGPADRTTQAHRKDTAFCTLCQRDVEPVGAGKCPICQRFLRDNVVALKHGNRRRQPPTAVVARRTAIAEEMFKERGGREHVDVITRCRILEYATLSVQIEDVTNYLDEVGLQTVRGRTRTTPLKTVLELSARREHLAELLKGEATTSQPRTSTEDRARISPRELAERAEALVRSIRSSADDAATVGEVVAVVDGPVIDHAHQAKEPAPTTRVEPAQDQDVALKARDLSAWQVIHYNDASEVERRTREATELMMHMHGHPDYQEET